MEEVKAGPSGSLAPRNMSLERILSDISLCDTDDDSGENDTKENDDGFVPSPLVSLKEHLERDKFGCLVGARCKRLLACADTAKSLNVRIIDFTKLSTDLQAYDVKQRRNLKIKYMHHTEWVALWKDDESLRKWKEKLLGCVDDNENGQLEPEVTFLSLGIVSENYPEFTTTLPIDRKHGDVLFTLKEGSDYRLKLTFRVKHNIVLGLSYSNTVWKGGFQVDQSKGMLGAFAPQQEPYVHMLEEETTPSGAMARGTYMAKLKFEDDDRRCHLELDYVFEIKKRS